MSTPPVDGPLVVALTIPCRAEYVGVARLAILGVASRLDFSFDEVEDLRLAVGEACAGAVERAAASGTDGSGINIRCDISDSLLTVTVNYACYAPAAGHSADMSDPENIGALLMEILVDSVDVTRNPETGTTIRLTKSVQPQ